MTVHDSCVGTISRLHHRYLHCHEGRVFEYLIDFPLLHLLSLLLIYDLSKFEISLLKKILHDM